MFPVITLMIPNCFLGSTSIHNTHVSPTLYATGIHKYSSLCRDLSGRVFHFHRMVILQAARFVSFLLFCSLQIRIMMMICYFGRLVWSEMNAAWEATNFRWMQHGKLLILVADLVNSAWPLGPGEQPALHCQRYGDGAYNATVPWQSTRMADSDRGTATVPPGHGVKV